MNNKIKLGIIGVGNMGSCHAKNIIGGKCPEIELVAIADIKSSRIDWAKKNISENITYFDDAIKMLDSKLIDSCIISVPHYFHPKYAMECMKRGINVMVEKPAGVYTKQVQEMKRLSQILCKPPMWCKIGTTHWRNYYVKKKQNPGGK